MPHIPVLLNEAIKFLDPKPGEFIIDGTIDGGGHAAAIVEKISPGGLLLGVDLDSAMISAARNNITANSKLLLVNDNYANLPEILKEKKLGKARGLLIDLGFSSEQLIGKGMSFQRDEFLDMRYSKNFQFSISNFQTGADVVNKANEKDLAEIIWRYGEERFSRRIAKKIVEARKKKRIETTFELADIVKSAVPQNYERGRIHPATRTFQALRIYVNRELENLENLLNELTAILSHGGRVVIISYHSLEDRLVKNHFRDMARENKIEILTKKPVIAGDTEKKINLRSRSAKLRAAAMK